MKRFVACAFPFWILAASAGTSFAVPLGFRGGFTLEPDQVHLGIHSVVGEPFAGVSFVPNMEIGFGDDIAVIAFNSELVYTFPKSATSNWGFYAGGGLGINYMDWDSGRRHDKTDTDFGLNALGGMIRSLSNGSRFFLELKLGLIDSPDAKITAGLTFY